MATTVSVILVQKACAGPIRESRASEGFCFHTEAAKLNGATNAEVEDALNYAKSTTGWSTYINGSQADLEVFKKEVRSMVDYAKAQAEKSKAMK